jgi:Cu+-exporting ATPase
MEEPVRLGCKPERGLVDPVCGMTVDPLTAAADREHDGRGFSFCSEGCAAAFDVDPARYAGRPTPIAGEHHGHH